MFKSFHATADSPEDFLAAVEKARTGGNFSPVPPETMTEKFPHEHIDVNGFGLHLLQMGAKQRVIFFLHGGAYVLGISDGHWSLMEKLGVPGEYHTAVFDYPLAPEHKAEEALEATVAAYDILVERYGAENIVLMGGSAGAGLAMGLSLKLRDLKRAQPRNVILLYPWLDVTMSHPEARPLESKDLLLGVDGLIACGRNYAGSLGVKHPYVSPWYAELNDLPPIHISSGTWDLLHPEGRDFVQKVKAAGGEADISIFPEMQHAWILFDIPEAQAAIKNIIDVISSD